MSASMQGQTILLTVPFVVVWLLSSAQFFATPQTITRQAPLSMGFPRQEYWSGLPFSPPEDLPDAGIGPASPALLVDSLPLSPQGRLTRTLTVAKVLGFR